jgi:GT2 family glycosyltransferase
VTGATCDVVIATRNRPVALRRCLEGLSRQTTSGFGIIVVDDCSDEKVDDLIDRAWTGEGSVHVERLEKPSGPARARNAGVAASAAEHIVFVDDDVVANRHFIEAHLETVRASTSDRSVVSCGPFVEPGDWTPTPWNLWEARQARKEAENLLRGVYEVTWRQFHTGNNCLSRAVFEAAAGFDDSFKRAEDDELALRLDRLGCGFVFQPRAIAWHYSERSLDAWLAIPRAYAHYDVEIERRYPEVGHLADKKAELAARRLPLRIARVVCDGPRRRRIGVAAATRSATSLYRLGFTSAAMGALSVAYHLNYVDSLRESERALVADAKDRPC